MVVAASAIASVGGEPRAVCVATWVIAWFALPVLPVAICCAI